MITGQVHHRDTEARRGHRGGQRDQEKPPKPHDRARRRTPRHKDEHAERDASEHRRRLAPSRWHRSHGVPGSSDSGADATLTNPGAGGRRQASGCRRRTTAAATGAATNSVTDTDLDAVTGSVTGIVEQKRSRSPWQRHGSGAWHRGGARLRVRSVARPWDRLTCQRHGLCHGRGSGGCHGHGQGHGHGLGPPPAERSAAS